MTGHSFALNPLGWSFHLFDVVDVASFDVILLTPAQAERFPLLSPPISERKQIRLNLTDASGLTLAFGGAALK